MAADARKSPKAMGFIRAQMPVGLRKSGMPDSVLMPAPVNTTARLDAWIRRPSAAMSRAPSMPGTCRHGPSATSRGSAGSGGVREALRAAVRRRHGFAHRHQPG
jgi:hypothetical protein